MEDHKMFGRRTTYQNLRRCDFCGKATHNGYLVNDKELRGFFCSAQHAQAAYDKRVELAEEQGMGLEEDVN